MHYEWKKFRQILRFFIAIRHVSMDDTPRSFHHDLDPKRPSKPRTQPAGHFQLECYVISITPYSRCLIQLRSHRPTKNARETPRRGAATRRLSDVLGCVSCRVLLRHRLLLRHVKTSTKGDALARRLANRTSRYLNTLPSRRRSTR